MVDSRSILLVGKPAYYWGYISPVAREFQRRFGEPVKAAALNGVFSDEPLYVQPTEVRPFQRANLAIAFDVWSMIVARACARKVVYVHHSLVGKGLVFRGTEPFRPFAFADTLCLPLPDHEFDVPSRIRRKVEIIGHLPFDWLTSETPLTRWQNTLAIWGNGGQKVRVSVLCTHGDFGSVHFLKDISDLQSSEIEFGVKLHGYLKKRCLPAGMRDLGDCPTALVIERSDVVVTDHSTAAAEAYALGVPCICYRSKALTQLQQKYPTLSELRYLSYALFYETVAELAALLKTVLPRTLRVGPPQGRVGQSAAARLLDLCINYDYAKY